MPGPMPKTLFIKTYGCQMNVYDSERMAAAMAAAEYRQVDAPEDADLVILNTCHIREKAAEKVYSELGRLKPLKAARPGMKIAVAGCVAQAEGAEILRRQPLVDLVVGPQAYHRLPAMAAAAEGSAGQQLDTEMPEELKFDHLPPVSGSGSASRLHPAAFLTVQEGCDKFCAFCVVPYTRGAEVSRPAEKVLAEARGLVRRGAVEITLLGQNVNAYHGEGPDGAWSLARLIRALADIDGLARIRYTTSHPNDMADDLIAAHGAEAKLMPYLHLPVQAGSDRVLNAMNRRHTAGDYLRLIERIRAARPDIAISGDFITGFPGETEADFDADARARARGPLRAGLCVQVFAAPRHPCGRGASQVPDEIRADRLARLQALLAGQQAEFRRAQIGRTLPVLDREAGAACRARWSAARPICRRFTSTCRPTGPAASSRSPSQMRDRTRWPVGSPPEAGSRGPRHPGRRAHIPGMRRSVALAVALALAASVAGAQVPGDVRVDVELVLAVDVSRSMTPHELEIQRRGYAEAIASAEVVDAIRGGPEGRVALSYMEWAGAGSHRTVVDWMLIGSTADARAFAGRLTARFDVNLSRTSISGAIDAAAAGFDGNGYAGWRQVIDVSGDGPNNHGWPVEQARNAALARGIVINGLPLMTDEGMGRQWHLSDLDRYYRDCVIGGPAAFVVPVMDWTEKPANLTA